MNNGGTAAVAPGIHLAKAFMTHNLQEGGSCVDRRLSLCDHTTVSEETSAGPSAGTLGVPR